MSHTKARERLERMLELENLTVGYGQRQILKEVALSLPAGQILTLLGKNGCGKSTLLRTMAGLLKPLSGRVLLTCEGVREELYRLPPRRRAERIAFLPQMAGRLPDIPVRSFVRCARYPYQDFFKRAAPEDETLVRQAMEQAEILELADKNLCRLSGGELQRVRLAFVFAQNTPVLLLDEPTTFLDVRCQLEILSAIRRRNREHGTTVVMVLHDISHGLTWSDQVAVAAEGRIAFLGTPQQVMDSGAIDRAFEVEAGFVRQGQEIFCTVRPRRPEG